MKRNIISSLAATFITAAVTLGSLTACSNEDIVTDTQNATQARTYAVSIPATIGGNGTTRAVDFDANGTDITTTFSTTDKIYVYNQTQQAWASNGWDDYITLSPTANSQKTNLTGALKFYYMTVSTTNGTILNGHPITPAVGDVLHLYCNPRAHFDEPLNVGFFYYDQTGSVASASAHDFVKATMKIKSIDGNATDGYTLTLCQVDDETKSTAMFQNVGSMYRQRLTFKNASNETVTPSITGIRISSKNNKLINKHWPLGEFFNSISADPHFPIPIDNPVIDTNGDIYLALRFVGSDGTDALTLTATDSEKNVYECTKAAPGGGFQNGKYYYGSMTLAWIKQLIMPTITGATAMDEPNVNGRISFDDNPADITFSGTSSGYYFMLWYYGKVTFNNLTATYRGTDSAFLNQNKSAYDNEIVLTGTNTLNCSTCVTAIDYNGNLKLSCTGSSATLNITTARADFCGLNSKNYNYDSNSNYRETTTELNVPSLAKDGYTVTRSARVDNSDGSYTWTYTVTKNN